MARLNVIGLMSGTSLDGVDAAMITTDGVEIGNFGPSVFVAYSTEEQAILRDALGLWPQSADGRLDAARAIVHLRHLQAIALLPKADLIGFHGQTLAHDPEHGRTHQLGDGSLIASATKTKTAWDFRSEDMRQGGQGAPLVPFFHHALARRAGLQNRVAFLNIGGVANVTFVNPRRELPQDPATLLAFDTGPGNAILNDVIAARTGAAFDRDGLLAAQGKADAALVKKWLGHKFFAAHPPKSLDRNDFQAVHLDVAKLETKDALATLTAFSVETIALAIDNSPAVGQIYVCGGGRKNLFLLAALQKRLPQNVLPVEHLNFDGDMLEAQAFAFLAAKVLHDLPTTAPTTTGCKQPTCGGKVSAPNVAS